MVKTKRILCVGKICLDTVTIVDGFPEEDEEVVSLTQRVSRGGNASNTSVVLANLSETVEYFGVVFKDESKVTASDAVMLRAKTTVCINDLESHGVITDNIVRRHLPGMSSTFIAININNASRTMFNSDTDLQEPTYEEFLKLNLENYKWVHFEGRNVDAVMKMIGAVLLHNKDTNNNEVIKFSVELELPSVKNVQLLAQNADLVIFGKTYAKYHGFNNPLDAASGLCKLTKPGSAVVVAWGELGASFVVNRNNHIPKLIDAVVPEAMIDTMGAGDTFNAAVIRAICAETTLQKAVEFGCAVASKKIGQFGFDSVKGMDNLL